MMSSDVFFVFKHLLKNNIFIYALCLRQEMICFVFGLGFLVFCWVFLDGGGVGGVYFLFFAVDFFVKAKDLIIISK